MPWRARIRDGGDRVLGAGILLGTQHVLTCAHLLLEGADGAPMKDRTADFVGLPGTPPVQVRIAEGSWVPPLDGGRGDVALLELERPQPDGAGAELHRMPQTWGARRTRTGPLGVPGLPRPG